MESALRGMYQANMDLGIFQETKCTDGIYTHESAGYRVVSTDAPSRHSGGVALFYRLSPLFAVEAVLEYGLNVMSCEVATGARRWYIIGCYLAPDDTETIERVVTALGYRPKGTALIVEGDLNTDLEDSESDRRGTEITTAMTEAGVEDMTAHFLPRKRSWGRERRTWSMVREGKVVRSRTEYLLGTDRSIFRNVSVQDPRHNTNHFMVVGCLHSSPKWEHTHYIMGRWKISLRPPTEPTREDGIFEALRRAVPKPHARDRHKNAWISEETWRLVDKRVSARRGTGVRMSIRRLGRAIRASLQGNRKRRVEAAGQDAETLLGEDPPNPKEAWRRLKGWYKDAVNRAPPPAQARIETYTATYHPGGKHPGYRYPGGSRQLGTYGGRD